MLVGQKMIVCTYIMNLYIILIFIPYFHSNIAVAVLTNIGTFHPHKSCMITVTPA